MIDFADLCNGNVILSGKGSQRISFLNLMADSLAGLVTSLSAESDAFSAPDGNIQPLTHHQTLLRQMVRGTDRPDGGLVFLRNGGEGFPLPHLVLDDYPANCPERAARFIRLAEFQRSS